VNIVVSGYTAAGKTTHTRLLARDLGFECISAAEILLQELGFDLEVTSESEIWFNRNAEINRRRQKLSIDDELDRFLLHRATTGQGIVFDARFLPWLAEVPMLRMWLASDLPSRARKCCVSVQRGVADVADCAQRIHDKDNLDVSRLAKTRGCIFGPDRALFDVILDNSSFIPAPTVECAEAGVRQFHPYVLAAVQAMSGNADSLRRLQIDDKTWFPDVVRFINWEAQGRSQSLQFSIF
jgi:cytidylate kinase